AQIAAFPQASVARIDGAQREKGRKPLGHGRLAVQHRRVAIETRQKCAAGDSLSMRSHCNDRRLRRAWMQGSIGGPVIETDREIVGPKIGLFLPSWRRKLLLVSLVWRSRMPSVKKSAGCGMAF